MRAWLLVMTCGTVVAAAGGQTLETPRDAARLMDEVRQSWASRSRPADDVVSDAGRARAIMAAHGRQDEEFAIWRFIATTYNEAGRHDHAKRAARDMREAARKAHRPFWEASALSLSANADVRLRNFEDAFLAARQAYQLHANDAANDVPPFPAARVMERASACLVLGTVYNELGDPRSALSVLESGLPDASEARRMQPRSMIRLLIGRELGRAHFRLGNHRKAITVLKDALDETPDGPGGPLATTHGVLADAYVATGQIPLAEAHVQQSLVFARRADDPRLLSEMTNRVGHLAMHRADPSAAETAFRAGSGSLHPYHAIAGLGDVYGRQGKLEAALDQYEKAIELIEQQLLEPRALEADRSGVFRTRVGPYLRAVDALLRLHSRSPEAGYARRAFMANQRIRDRIFADRLAAEWSRSRENPGQFARDLKAIDERIASVSRALQRPDRTDPADGLNETLERLEIEQAGLRRAVSLSSPLAGRARREAAISVDEVQRLLPPGTALLDYAMADLPAVFVVTRESFRVVELPPPNRLIGRVRAYVGLVSSGSGSALGAFGTRGGHELFKEMVEPALRGLPDTVSHLIVAPGPALEHLPFEALPIRRDGPYLIDAFSISYLPAAGALPLIMHEPDASRTRLLAFANPDVDERRSSSIRGFFDEEGLRLGALPFADAEVDAISDIVGPGRSEILTGGEASESRLKSITLTDYTVLHFATHAVGSRSLADRSSLVLSGSPDGGDDGFLQVREIYDLRLNADLVVLSACQTGAGAGEPGDGVHGLSRAFFFAGARSLVASLWKVEDEPTARLMTLFYGHLREGLSKAESLRRAKRGLIEEGYAHPRYWAAFVLFGDAAGRPLALVPAPARRLRSGYALALLFAVGGAGLCVLWFRRGRIVP